MFESRIHTAVFYVVYLLLFGYGVLLPPYAVYWAEGISGPGWAVLMLGVTTSFFVFASRFHVLTTPQTRGVSNLLNKFRSGALGVSLPLQNAGLHARSTADLLVDERARLCARYRYELKTDRYDQPRAAFSALRYARTC